MAQRATPESVAADMRPPNFRGAVQRLRTIKPKKEKVASINADIGGIFDTVEGYKVNKKAAKIFLALDALESEEQQDIFRSLKGLIEAAEWSIGDLVDQAEGAMPGNVVTPDFTGKKGKGKAADAAPEKSGPDDGEIDAVVAEIGEPAATGDDDAPAPAETETATKRLTPAEARERAKAHFGAGTAPPPSTETAAQEPYTGDNSDLAGGDDE